MFRWLLPTVAVVSVCGAGYLAQNFRFDTMSRFPLVPAERTEAAAPGTPPPPATREMIRVATFNLGRFEETHLARPRCREILSQLISRFDLLALQGLRAGHHGLLVQILEQVNQSQRAYDFAVDPELGDHGIETFNAFVFDRASIEVDRTTLSGVEDPSGRLVPKPLIGLFRTRGAPPSEAFTFLAVNVALSPQSEGDLVLLEQAYRQIRNRWSAEDDVLLLGSIGLDDRQLLRWEQSPGLTCPLPRVPTTTRGTQMADQILLPVRATREFTGRAGVIDLMREFGLSMPEAMEISEHLPVWCELSVYEGGHPGHVARAD